ncbi:unnamed protein product [Clonostachys rhizophaga]|uniref:Rhodopsin domain-containing protein n=1 Tax=Clonostachys rhizophaga TaxID=160324 RepID=A0A9N9V8H4_9HYPO|nr:unnamed protein product [Clonostachys rhizophaga]
MERSISIYLMASRIARADDDTGSIGVLPAPPGVTPDLQNPRDAGRKTCIIIMSVCLGLVTILFFLRSYVKIRLVRNSFLEDVTCTIAWAMIVVFTATVLMTNSYGVGYHVWEISQETYLNSLKWLWGCSVAYCPAAFFTKTTLLLLIARVFAVEERTARAIYCFIIFILILYLPIQIVKTIICLPIRSYWDKSVPGRCLDQKKAFVVDLSVAILTDLVILLLPIPLTWNLRMPRKQKLKIWALLGTGGVAVATTVYRMVKAIQFMHQTDVTADIIALDLSTMVELTIGFSCACLPALNILFQRRSNRRSDGNSPRTSKNNSPWRSWKWDFMSSTGKPTSSATIHHSAPSRLPSVTETKAGPVNFDVELAMISDPDGVNATVSSPREHEEDRNGDHWFVHERANSLDGRRQGWLDPKMHQQTQNPASYENVSEDSRTSVTNPSTELARVSGNRPWSRIFDGTDNSPPP